MKLAILGASGATGRHLVAQALEAGHTVTAVGRASSDLDHVPPGRIVRGSPDDERCLADAFEGVDVVLVALGLKLSGLSPLATCEDATFMSRSGPVIAAAANRAGVKRILAVSAGGAGDSYAMMPLFFKAFIAMTAMRKVYPELDLFERALMDGPVEACCVRPTGLTDEPATGQVVIANRLVGQASIPRADVAAFMLAYLEGELPGQGPVITVTGAG
ncbi:MAG: NAD(P)H-binding protein [Proteobacteria bacterium]|nr:NAD(P)H-binding protein [Pseudomonadota bacterium]